MANALLSIQNISKHYTGKTALDSISMDVPKGCIYGLLGPNGAGKTSLIRIINQITQADEGRIEFNGELMGPQHLKKIGYLPEERGLYKKIQVIRQLQYFGQLRGLSFSDSNRLAKYWLEKLGLMDVKNKRTDELSKGMQQKVQFIVSVMHQPELLILDEPFSGFDPLNAELLTQIILELRDAGSTILFSTHRMENVEQLCDSMCMIHHAHKILDGKVNEIKNGFSMGAYEIVTSEKITETIPGFELISSSKNGNWHQIVKLNGVSKQDFIALLNKSYDLISFAPHLPSIHDIFIQMAGDKNTGHA